MIQPVIPPQDGDAVNDVARVAQNPREALLMQTIKDLREGGWEAFFREVDAWGDATFGTPAERGPIGPLKHLAKEVQECLDNPTDPLEYVDCLFLVRDASRRAGLSGPQLLAYCWEKLNINRARTWPKPTSDGPVEHVREDV